MNWETWIPLLIAISAWIPKLLELLGGQNGRTADAAKTIVEGGAEAVKAMRDILADYDRINDDQRAEIKTLKDDRIEHGKQIDELRTHKDQRDKEIADLKNQNEDLHAAQIQMNLDRKKDAEEREELRKKYQADLEETRGLRNDYANAQRQILKLEDLAISAGEYINKIKTAVQNIPGVELPLNGEMMESVLRLKAERATRGKQ